MSGIVADGRPRADEEDEVVNTLSTLEADRAQDHFERFCIKSAAGEHQSEGGFAGGMDGYVEENVEIERRRHRTLLVEAYALFSCIRPQQKRGILTVVVEEDSLTQR